MYRRLFVQGAALTAGLCLLVTTASAQTVTTVTPPPPGVGLLVWLWTHIIVPGLGTW